MQGEEREFFEILSSFRSLNIATMFPNISHGDFGTMQTIRGFEEKNNHKGVKVSQLAKKMHIAVPAVSRCLRSLEEKGLIERTVDKEDRRNTYVVLTEKGKMVSDETDEIMSEFGKAVFGHMGKESMQQLNSYLKELRETAMKEIQNRKYQKREDEAKHE